MDLYSGMPYWIVKNPLDNYFNPLSEDTETDVVIIGSGITGALVANEMCREGLECVVVDKRSLSTGSSVASTALLQYEIDVPLVKLIGIVGEKDAVEAYRACLNSIDDLEETFIRAGFDPAFQRLPSLFYASKRKDDDLIIKEFRERKKHGLPVEVLGRSELRSKYGIKRSSALQNHVSAQLDAYQASTGLLSYNMARNGLRIFTHTEISQWKKKPEGYLLRTPEGHGIRTRYVVVAAGFEAGKFLPRKLMDLTTTFAIISEPVDPEFIWKDSSLIWETAQPYLYIRTDGRNRIIVGGEDEKYNNATARRFQIDRKSKKLESKFRKLMPSVPFRTEMAWCGTFSSTTDGLPLIGPWPGDDRMLYALGYGGNGITFSMTAAQIVTARIKGRKDPREDVFSLSRKSLK